MTIPPAIIAVDIDGTLLSRSGTVLPGTRAEFARATAAGATVLLASGRPVAGLRRLVERLRLDSRGFVLAGSNGSMSVDADTGEVLARHSVPHDVTQEIVQLTAEHGVLTMLCAADTLVVERADHPQVGIEADGNDLAVREVESFADLPDDVAADKILMYGPPAQLRPFAEVFAERFAGRAEFAFSAPFYFEATAAGVDKGSALADLAAARGVAESDSVAFGDNGNDLPMIRRAGVGVAMGNAIDEVREAADRITASNDDEGIAIVLRELYGGGRPAPEVEIPDVEPLYHGEVDLSDPNASFAPADGGDVTDALTEGRVAPGAEGAGDTTRGPTI